MSEQATSGEIEQVSTNGGRQCSGCHRRHADLTLFENGKLYCSTCSANVTRLGIEPVIREDRPLALEAPGRQPAASEPLAVVVAEAEAEPVVEHTDEPHEVLEADAAHAEEQEMTIQPTQPEEIGVMPSLAAESTQVHAPAPAASADASLHAVLGAERARLLEQRAALERQFRADVDAIDSRLSHVESLLGSEPESRAS